MYLPLAKIFSNSLNCGVSKNIDICITISLQNRINNAKNIPLKYLLGSFGDLILQTFYMIDMSNVTSNIPNLECKHQDFKSND